MQEEARVEKRRRFAKIWWDSRARAGKSQEFMAIGIGVSKKTIQNWERGISAPDLYQSAEWFRLLRMSPIPYYMAFLYPELYEKKLSGAEEDRCLQDALAQMTASCSPAEKRQLLFLMADAHGSEWHALLQVFTAYCHTSMRSRVTAARVIKEQYEMDEEQSRLVCPDCARPDMQVLENMISKYRDELRRFSG